MSEVNDKISSARTELNNNNSNLSVSSQRNVECASSGSSTNSDISDGDNAFLEGDEPKVIEEDIGEPLLKKRVTRKLRSMSDGQALPLDQMEPLTIIPDSVLKELELDGEKEKERINEKELEEKFTSLKLAFSTDSVTIKDRSERQKRYRDQTETNLNAEIEKLINKITEIRPLCGDAQNAEHLTSLLTQVDIIIRAASLASISAERFGAVQHEARLAEAINLMINHVTLLKQQRDSTRKQLQNFKKHLQDTNISDFANTKRTNSAINDRFLTQRRASIATIAQSQEPLKTVSSNLIDGKRLTRRTSDISSRVSAFAHSSRPSRLELGVDLDKIREGIVDDNSSEPSECPEDCIHEDSNTAEESQEVIDCSKLSIKDSTISRVKQVRLMFQERYRIYSENGKFHEFLYLASLLCFMLGVVLLGNFLIEIQYSGIKFSQTNIQEFCRNEFQKKRIN